MATPTAISGLEIRKCSKRYGSTRALDGVSFAVRPGEVVGLVGANGAGKTTLLHALVGLIKLDDGDMTLDGESVWSVSSKRGISFMPDDLPRPVRLTGRELIELNCRLYGRVGHEIGQLAEKLEMGPRLDQPLSGYSHGMRRKIDLMAALAVAPRLLVLDEPFSGLDPGMVATLQEILKALRGDGVSILVSSHDLELVQALADNIVLIDFGRVIFSGHSSELMSKHGSPDLRSAFLTVVRD